MNSNDELIDNYITFLSTPYLLPVNEFIFFFFIHLALFIFLLSRAYKQVMLVLAIKNTPTATIRSATQGIIELKGLTSELTPMTSPLTNTPCVWWSYRIEEYKFLKGNKFNHFIEEKQSIDAFILRDKTGECVIHPEGSTVIPHRKRVWHGNSPNPISSMNASSEFHLEKKYTYTELILLPGYPVYCLGMHHTLRFDPCLLDTSDIIKKWKRDFKSLLAKYDHNNNGIIDQKEWLQVMKDAENSLLAKQELNLQHTELLNLISEDGLQAHQHFIVSGKNEAQLLKEKARSKKLLILLTTLLGAHIIYELLSTALM